MKHSYFFTFIFFTQLCSVALNGMDRPSHYTGEMINFMDQTSLDRFHIKQLLSMYLSAEQKEWKTFNQTLSIYAGPLNVINDKGLSLVHVAVNDNQKETTSILIDRKAPLTHFDMLKHPIVATPLHYAAYKGHTEIAQLLINSGKVDINSIASSYNNTPLHLAAWSNHPKIVQMLITAKALIDKVNTFGSTPIHSAAWKNSVESLEILLQDNKNATQSNKTGRGNTPLYLAAKAGSKDCIQLLIDHLQKTLSKDDFTHHLNQEYEHDHFTSVHTAGHHNHVQCYWNLILAGADYRQPTKFGKKTYVLEKIITVDGSRSSGTMIQNECSLSETIMNNEPIKNFIKHIEKHGMNNPPHYKGSHTSCCMCNTAYKNNDIVVDITSCKHSFHTDCFKDHALDIAPELPTLMKNYLESDLSSKDIKHEISTTMAIDWNRVKKCPHCLEEFLLSTEGKIGVFLRNGSVENQ